MIRNYVTLIKGVLEAAQLIGVVNQWRGIGVGQPNGSNNSNSNMNGSISSSGGKAIVFKLDDRLNV